MLSEQCDLALSEKETSLDRDSALDTDSINIQIHPSANHCDMSELNEDSCDRTEEANANMDRNYDTLTSADSGIAAECFHTPPNTVETQENTPTEAPDAQENTAGDTAAENTAEDITATTLAYPQLYTPCLTSVDASSIVAHSKPLMAACIRALVLANPRMRTLALSWPLLDDCILGYVAENCAELQTIDLVS